MKSCQLALASACALVAAEAAHADVHVLHATLDGDHPVPPVATPARGFAIVTVDDASGYVHVYGGYGDVATAVSDVALYGPANPGAPPTALLSAGAGAAGSGDFEAAAIVSATVIAAILDGATFVSLRSQQYPSGEVGGDVRFESVRIEAALDGAQAATLSAGAGTCEARVDRHTRRLDLSGSYSGLGSPLTAAQLRGPAWFGSAGPLLLDLAQTGGTAGDLRGAIALSASELDDLLDGFLYVELRTSAFPLGELRGQLSPPFLGTDYCVPEQNAHGQRATLRAIGSPRASDDDVTLLGTRLTPASVALAVASRSSGQLFPLAGSAGRVCVAGPSVARLGATLQATGLSGHFVAALDLAIIPTSPPVGVAAGDTWNFQVWYRDHDPLAGATSNFTNAVSISFR